MDALFDSYPVFEANQVLTSAHLNDVFDYLDQQTRLTRSRLVGIGIVCGFDISLDGPGGIKITRGCGVTSEGYLIDEPGPDLTLTAYRDYKLPETLAYPPFQVEVDGKPGQYKLFELFPSGISETTKLADDVNFLNDKAVLLFLELKKQGLRNCSPNNCDDKGSEVTATVRKLLVAKADLEKIMEAEKALKSGLTPADLDAAAVARLGLPDLRVPRFDVVNSGPTTANDVYAAFLNTFRSRKLVDATSIALRGAYQAFKPLLEGAWPNDPFANFTNTYGFLEKTPQSAAQVQFLQYYVGLFEDVLSAYDEFRWKGLELLCACSPPDNLFPRHLMLGLAHPESVARPARYRQSFLPSPATGCCSGDTKALLQLFARLVEVVTRFTNAPALAKANDSARMDPQIRITPSVLGERPLGSKAIPFYYRLTGDRPLYRLWNVEKTLRNRANQNLGYRFDEYQPAAPAFVSDPLRYDLEPYNFLRIEGHLGKDYRRVLGSLLETKSEFRLPFDVIALRAGAYDDKQPIDLSKESARFQDLEALYDSLREDLLSTLAAGAMELYEAPIPSERAAGAPKLPLLKTYQPNFRYSANSLGAYYESRLQSLQALPYLEVDQTLFSDIRFGGEVLKVFCILFFNEPTLPAEFRAHVVSIFYFTKLAEILPEKLDALGFADFANRYQDLIALVHYFRHEAAARTPKDLQTFLPDVELVDHFDNVLFSCKLEAIRSVHVEYVKRVGELRKRQFLSTFLQHHPGIQHKAGVPFGGTFILVYHGLPPSLLEMTQVTLLNTLLFAELVTPSAPAPVLAPAPTGVTRGLSGVPLRAVSSSAEATSAPSLPSAEKIAISNIAAKVLEPGARTKQITDTINRISSNKTLAENQDVAALLEALAGRGRLNELKPTAVDDPVAKIIAATVDALADGTVIADFFLPYRLVPDTIGAQFVLPKALPTFTAQAGCTSADGIASVTIDVRAGDAPYDIAIDQGGYQALSGKTVSLAAGAHTLRVRDAAGTETQPVSINIPPAIAVSEPVFNCKDNKYTATFTVSGGTPPYTVNDTNVAEGGSFTTEAADSGTSVTVDVVDSVLCSSKPTFTHTCPPPCDLPCAGSYVRRGYRMWLPDPDPNNPYTPEFKLEVQAFTVQATADSAAGAGETIDLSDKMRDALGTPADPSADFPGTVKKWLSVIHKVIAGVPTLNKGTLRWLQFNYEPVGLGRLGTLWIDHFECLNFEIRMTVTFMRRLTQTEVFEMVYTPKGTEIRGRTVRPTSVPPFDGFSINKCDAASQAVDFCPGRPPVALEISRDGAAGTLDVALIVKPSPDNIAAQFLWEVQNAVPSIGSGKTFKTRFTDAAGGTAFVTAYTKEGCSVTFSQQISLR